MNNKKYTKTLYRLLQITLLLLLAFPIHAQQEIEVFYIPQEDMHKAPGYASSGVHLPLSEILALSQRAWATSNTQQLADLVYCPSLQLKGALKNNLELEGDINFIAPAGGWNAVLVDDGSIPWLSQKPTLQGSAFLARVQGRTFLYAKGPSKGAISLKALFPVPFEKSKTSLKFGAIYTPCRMDIEIAPEIEPLAPFMPIQLDKSAQPPLLTLFPIQGKQNELRLRRVISIDAPPSLRVFHNRTVSLPSGGVSVADEIILSSRFIKGKAIEFPLPAGLRLLRTNAINEVSVSATSNVLTLLPLVDISAITFNCFFAADVKNQTAELGAWNIAADSIQSSLKLQNSEKYIPLPDALPPSFILAESTASGRFYQCWDALPPLRISLAPRTPAIPPAVSADLRIARNEATIIYLIKIADKSRDEISFTAPASWVLTEFTSSTPCNLIQKEGIQWRVGWQTSRAPDEIRITLHRVGIWGAPKTAFDLLLPLLHFAPPAPLTFDLAVSWTEGLDIRAKDLSSVKIIPTTDTTFSQNDSTARNSLALRAIGNAPLGSLAIEGREANVKAIVITTLSIGEESALARARIQYQVQTAPASSFQFILPSGSAPSLRINGEGIRETSMRSTPQGEEWTIVLQNQILGNWEAFLEWTLDSKTNQSAINAPEILVKNITSQKGFIILEGSETLRLTAVAKGLTETDVSDLPPETARTASRILAVYRYIQPPYTLSVSREKFEPEPLLKGLVSEAGLAVTPALNGDIYTLARYNFTPMAERQFFEAELPENSELWAALVNGEGVQPSSRKTSDGRSILLIPLPSSGQRSSEFNISIMFKQSGLALHNATRMVCRAPVLSVPVNRTLWALNLPQGLEYMSFKGSLHSLMLVREPFITLLRTAYYPERLLFEKLRLGGIIIITLFFLFCYWAIGSAIRSHRRKQKEAFTAGVEKPAKIFRFSIFELLIVIVIIIILAAMAVPNFLEAQVRSRTSRVKSDARSIATGLEAYYVDNNAYPPSAEILWQGAVKYLSTPFEDPYADYKGTPMKYVTGQLAYDRAIEAGYFDPDAISPSKFWYVYSVGPDNTDNLGMLLYDPTNGTVSAGDVVRFSGGMSPHTTRYADVKKQEIDRSIVMDEKLGREFDTGFVTKRPPAAPAPAAGFPASMAIPEGQIIADGIAPSEPTPAATPAPQQGVEYAMKKRAEGLLSLSIEMPAGGIKRSFEATGYETSFELRFMEHVRFLRIRFIVKMAAMLLLCAVWFLFRKHYKLILLAFIILCLLPPLLKMTPWVVFFNTAFQGALLSLVAPLIAFIARYAKLVRTNTAAALILAPLLLISMDASASAQTPETDSDTVRIVVPYLSDQTPDFEKDPLAFISQTHFQKLWNAAHKEAPRFFDAGAHIVSIALEGSLSPEIRSVQGNLVIQAVNTSDAPSSLLLQLAGMNIQSFSSNPQGSFIESGSEGLVLRMEKGWMGIVNASFTLPCETLGASGILRLVFPPSASGLWQINLPYPDVQATSGNVPILAESVEGGVRLRGFAKPGAFDLAWKAERTKQTLSGSKKWRAEIETGLRWHVLSSANWYASIKMESTEAGGALPEEARFTLDPGIRLYAADGTGLAGVSVSGSEVVIKLKEDVSTEVVLSGFLLKPDGNQPALIWNAAGIRAPKDVESRTTLVLQIFDQIEVVSIKTENLERRATAGARQGYSVQNFEAVSADWSAALELRRLAPTFNAAVTELIAPIDGILCRAVSILITPKESRLGECIIALPKDFVVRSVHGDSIANWAQKDENLFIVINPPLENQAKIRFIAQSSKIVESGMIDAEPVIVRNAADVQYTPALLVFSDEELKEIELAGASPIPPTDEHREFVNLLAPAMDADSYDLRAYKMSKPATMRFQISPLEAGALITIFNQATVSDGLQTMESIVRAEPRRGRIKEIGAYLLLPFPDAQAASRIQSSGPIRNVRIANVSDRVLHIVAELNAPAAAPVHVRFQFDQPAATEDGNKLQMPVLIPEEGAGARSLLLARRAFEGELSISEKAGAREIDPQNLKLPDLGFIPLPSDKTFELSIGAKTAPSFLITRHKRDEMLRAIVEILRQRTLITPDGVERNELEIALQNQSEQFLKIALPYPQSQVSIYEVQVASRPVRATFGKEGGREVLLVPLIRTGLLDPELTVRVAYTVRDRGALSGSGIREQKLPEILGGVPISQSVLVLMLPTDFSYSKFHGTLNRVELVDIEVDEALRRAKQAERLSEAVLYSSGDKQEYGLFKLREYKSRADESLQYAAKSKEAYTREAGRRRAEGKKDAVQEEEKLEVQRGVALEQAKISGQNVFSNEAQLNQMVQNRAIQQQIIIPPQMQQIQSAQTQAPAPDQIPPPLQNVITPPPQPVIVPPIQFPRSGDVFVFRQIQGTGFIRFKYSSRESFDRLKDVMLIIILTILTLALMRYYKKLFSTRRRIAFSLLITCVIATIFNIALDLAIPLFAISLFLLRKTRKPAPPTIPPSPEPLEENPDELNP